MFDNDLRYRPITHTQVDIDVRSWREYPWLSGQDVKYDYELSMSSQDELSLDELGQMFLRVLRNAGFDYVDSIIFNRGYNEKNEQMFTEVDMYETYSYENAVQMGIVSENKRNNKPLPPEREYLGEDDYNDGR